MPGCLYVNSGKHDSADLSICPAHREQFRATSEGKRLAAIAQSLLAEWAERERCEKLNAGLEQVATPVTSEDT